MQIKSIITAAGALACLMSGWATVAATGAALNLDSRIAWAGEILTIAAMSEDQADAKIGQADPAEQDMANTGNAPATTSIRNTRPKIDRHRDARVCLNEANIKAIIKCANKYR